ncbi:ABC transporter ATP-binding protein, partial [Candidatus Aerophobetes bacterium]|nr:ABC transporter ATP-binding protein [Candidatus Aerophobetes bacterium]
RKEKGKKVLQIAELLDIKQILNEQANKLGAADAQTIALGRALIKGAGVLLLDEPLSSVEPEKRLNLRVKIKRIQKEEKKLFIYVTHDQSEALTLSDRVAVMKDGRVVQFDFKEMIYDEPADLFVGYFIGSPGMNILEGEFKEGKLNFGDFALPTPSHLQKSLERHKKFKMGIRPEYLGISKKEKEGWFLFKCDEIEERGRGVRVLYLKSKNKQNEIKASGSYFDISAGDKVWVEFPHDKVKTYDEEGKRIVT